MIEVIIGLALGFAIAFFFEMQNQEAHNDSERAKEREANYKSQSYAKIPYAPNALRVVISSAVGGVLGFIVASFTIISAGHQGVQTTLGEVNMNTLNEGLHFVNPISNVSEVNVRVTKA
jgi:hypothetical protein